MATQRCRCAPHMGRTASRCSEPSAPAGVASWRCSEIVGVPGGRERPPKRPLTWRQRRSSDTAATQRPARRRRGGTWRPRKLWRAALAPPATGLVTLLCAPRLPCMLLLCLCRAPSQVGYRTVPERKITKPELGHLQKAGVPAMKHLREFKVGRRRGRVLQQGVGAAGCRAAALRGPAAAGPSSSRAAGRSWHHLGQRHLLAAGRVSGKARHGDAGAAGAHGGGGAWCQERGPPRGAGPPRGRPGCR